MLGVLVGALGGGIAAYYWRDKIHDYISNRIPHLREQAANALGGLGDRACGALDRARSGLDAALRRGEERLQPTRRAGERRSHRGTGGIDSRDVSEGKIMLP
jgi:hypothetical protein